MVEDCLVDCRVRLKETTGSSGGGLSSFFLLMFHFEKMYGMYRSTNLKVRLDFSGDMML